MTHKLKDIKLQTLPESKVKLKKSCELVWKYISEDMSTLFPVIGHCKKENKRTEKVGFRPHDKAWIQTKKWTENGQNVRYFCDDYKELQVTQGCKQQHVRQRRMEQDSHKICDNTPSPDEHTSAAVYHWKIDTKDKMV